VHGARTGLAAGIAVLALASPAAGTQQGDRASSLWKAFTCIHHYETYGVRDPAAWHVNTGNGYYGGLQMDYTFQRQYGREYLRAWGSADHWPSGVQMAVAIRAYLSGRGFSPWPNTRRMCGV